MKQLSLKFGKVEQISLPFNVKSLIFEKVIADNPNDIVLTIHVKCNELNPLAFVKGEYPAPSLFVYMGILNKTVSVPVPKTNQPQSIKISINPDFKNTASDKQKEDWLKYANILICYQIETLE